MNDLLKFFIEFIVTFAVAFTFYYFVLIKQHKKIDEKKVPTEINIILKYHKIELKKINYKSLLVSVSIVTSLILSIIINIVFHFMHNNILVVIITLIVSLPIALVAYDIIGRIYEKKSNEIKSDEEKKIETKNKNKRK
jgi:peptidoglycan/LPS O-acetylase OafA/YrhL